LSKQVGKLKDKVSSLITAVETQPKACLESEIAKMPAKWQEAVRACISAANVSHVHQRRYTTEWIYECILLRIKSGEDLLNSNRSGK